MQCFTCNELTGDYNTDLQTCARCREVLKIDIVRILLEMDPIYLSEKNRNKKGRKPKLTATEKHDIIYDRKNGKSMGELAKKYKVSKATIFNTLHKKSNL